MRRHPMRREFIRSAVLMATAASVGACGFKLRGSATLPVETIYLSLPVNSPVGAEITRLLRASTNARVVTERSEAQAIFELLGENREREVVAINSQGRVSEFQIRLRVRFRVLNKEGLELIAPTELVTRRDISFNESDLLAKESEESLLYRDMQSDLVRQMVNRLQGMKVEAA